MCIFAYYTAILGAIYNMQRTKKAKGQIVRKRRAQGRPRVRKRESARGGGGEPRGCIDPEAPCVNHRA